MMESEKIESSCTDVSPQAFFCPPADTDSQRVLILDKIKNFLKHDNDEMCSVNIGRCNWECVGSIYSLTYHIVSVLRRLGLLPSERCILLPLEEQYQTIQLCLARINKQKHGEFMAAASDVLDVWNHIYTNTISSSADCKQNSSTQGNDLLEGLPLGKCDVLSSKDPMKQQLNEAVNHYQDFLSTSGCLDHFKLYQILKKHLDNNTSLQKEMAGKIFVIENINQMHKMEREMLKLILQKGDMFKVSVAIQESSEMPLKQDLDISGIEEDLLPLSQALKDNESGLMKEDIAQNDCLPTSYSSETIEVEIEAVSDSISIYLESVIPESSSQSASSESNSEEYVYQLMLSHVRLLVNTRDELALTVSLSMTGNEISHQNFTDIKQMAKGKNMPLYQSILSYIRMVRLGGSGYQPDPNCPVLLLQQPLGVFVDAQDKLQDIVAEEPDPRIGANRVIGAIKTSLVQARGCVLKRSTVDKVWMALKGALGIFMDKNKNIATDSNAKIQQTTARLRPSLKMLVHLLDWNSGLMTSGGIVDACGDNFLTQSQRTTSNTPLRIPTVLNMFRSPVGKGSEDDKQSLRERLLKKSGTPVAKKPSTAVNKFISGCAWASESSPVVESPNSTISPIVGPSLKAYGGPARSRSLGNTNWRRIVEEVAVHEEETKQEEAAEDTVKSSNEKGNTKRSLLSDISNIDTEPTAKKSKNTSEKSKKTAKKPAKEPAKEKLKEKVSKKNTKKCIPVPQGQKSIMNFFKTKDS